MTQSLALKGRTFGRLHVLGQASTGPSRHTRWLCECSCGNEATVAGTLLINGKTESCGCLHHDRLTAQGFKRGGFFASKKPKDKPTLAAVQRKSVAARKVPVSLAPVPSLCEGDEA